MKLKEHLQEAKFLSIAVVAVLTLGFFSSRGFLKAPASEYLPPSGRQPASFGGVSDATGRRDETRLETLVWDCQDLGPEASRTSGSHIRLKSRFCDSGPVQQLSVKNLSNGYTASVFVDSKGFSTDFIDLREGENEIEISWEAGHGTRQSRKLRLSRSLTSERMLESGTH